MLKIIDVAWTTFLVFISYILGWILLPTITILPDKASIKMPLVKELFELSKKNPELYFCIALILSFVLSFIVYKLLKKYMYSLYSNVYDKNHIQKKYAEFVEDARELDIFGGDLGFFYESNEQLKRVKTLRNDCRILCCDANSEKTKNLYHELMSSNVRLRKVKNGESPFANLRGQIKVDASGNLSCLIVSRKHIDNKVEYEVIDFNNQNLTKMLKGMFDKVFEGAKTPLIKLICFDLGGVYFDGDFYQDFLDPVNEWLPKKITVHHDQKLLLNQDLNLGNINITEWVEKEIGQPLGEDSKKNIIDKWKKVWKPNTQMKSLVKKLKQEGYQVGIFSNLDLINGDMYKEKGYFLPFPPEYHFLSYELKMTKPNDDFYKEIQKRTGLSPYEILLIDDHERNIVKAKNLGFYTIQYSNTTGIEELYRELKGKGIQLNYGVQQ